MRVSATRGNHRPEQNASAVLWRDCFDDRGPSGLAVPLPRNELRRAGLISPAQSRVSASPRIRAKVLPRSVIQILAQPRQQVWLLTAGLSSRSAADAIAEVNDAVSEPALFQEGERDADVVGQCALATTNDDRPEEQVQLVDQPRGDRLAG
jgi:hypothetical protein